jgi:hypothetical protein
MKDIEVRACIQNLKWIAAGFEPMKYLLGKRRVSDVFYLKTRGIGKELRRNNPHVISEVSVLAQTVLKNSRFPVDVIVENEIDGYPTNEKFKIKHLTKQQGISSLLRIERGRVTHRVQVI